MKGMLEFLRKVSKDKSGLYHAESDLIMENKIFIGISLFSLLFLVTPWGRWLLKWIAYISFGILILATLALVHNNYQTLKKSFNYDKKLEKLGTSREEEEEKRKQLCEMEGDDALPPQKKFVYFADAGALTHYANALYGCFLAQTFKAKYMQLPEDAVLYTTQTELNKLRKLEVEATDKDAPYTGYANFIRANFHVLKPVENSSEQEIINTALKLQLDLDPNVFVTIVSTNEALGSLVSEYELEFINPAANHEAEEEAEG